MPDGAGLVRRHASLFNEGVRSGDFTPMLAQFTDDAELVFVGVPVGPFHGKEAIADAYRSRPPDDQIDLLTVREQDDEIVAEYAWLAEAGRRAGELIVRRAGDRIARIVVTFDPGDADR